MSRQVAVSAFAVAVSRAPPAGFTLHTTEAPEKATPTAPLTEPGLKTVRSVVRAPEGENELTDELLLPIGMVTLELEGLR